MEWHERYVGPANEGPQRGYLPFKRVQHRKNTEKFF